ncbi:MAG: ZIP family metal transporter, partial [Candidatus Omnitrophota bacterium]|nr:ZIP family metal transporter [Candidatus Omnitrophota bacterium]
LDQGKKAKQIALMIAVGLGLHNLSEGLAIGQGYAAGATQLAWLLAIGFALHNATEGFGIAAPLSGHRASWGFLGLCGLIAGGPTFLGAALGSAWVSKPAEIFCLALAAGSILYIIGELLHLGRQLKGEALVSIGLLIGFFIAMGTDFTLAVAMKANRPVSESEIHLPSEKE